MKEQLLKYEYKEIKDSIYYKEGTIPILLSSPHTMEQIKEDGNIKLPEPFTKAIHMYISNTLDTYSIIKINDTGIDPNSETEEEYKQRINDTSSEYRKIHKIMEWVESESEGRFLFKNIGACYEDEVLELELKKASKIYSCDGVAYDTLKCSGVEDFAKLAATATKLT